MAFRQAKRILRPQRCFGAFGRGICIFFSILSDDITQFGLVLGLDYGLSRLFTSMILH